MVTPSRVPPPGDEPGTHARLVRRRGRPSRRLLRYGRRGRVASSGERCSGQSWAESTTVSREDTSREDTSREGTDPKLAVDESEPLGRQLSSSLIWQSREPSMENARELSSSSRRAERGDSRRRIWMAAGQRLGQRLGQRESAWQERSASAAWQRQLLRWAAAAVVAAATCSTPVLTPVLAAPRRSISLCQRPLSAESSASYTCVTSSSVGAEIDAEIDSEMARSHGAAAGARGPKPS